METNLAYNSILTRPPHDEKLCEDKIGSFSENELLQILFYFGNLFLVNRFVK